MILTYIDESYTASRYVMAAMLVPEKSAWALTAALDEVAANAQRSFGSELGAAELHGYDLITGKRDWFPLATMVRARIGVYDRALRALADHDVRIIIRSVDIPGLHKRHPTGHDHPHAVVLSHLVERIDEHLERIDEVGLLIADEVDGQDSYRRDLWTYQRSATKGYRSRQITRVVDALHLAPSSSSRLLQGADLIAYLARRRAVHVELDARARQASERLWTCIAGNIVHDGCWWPMGPDARRPSPM